PPSVRDPRRDFTILSATAADVLVVHRALVGHPLLPLLGGALFLARVEVDGAASPAIVHDVDRPVRLHRRTFARFALFVILVAGASPGVRLEGVQQAKRVAELVSERRGCALLDDGAVLAREGAHVVWK